MVCGPSPSPAARNRMACPTSEVVCLALATQNGTPEMLSWSSRTSATATAVALARWASTMPTVAAASAGASLMPSPTMIRPPPAPPERNTRLRQLSGAVSLTTPTASKSPRASPRQRRRGGAALIKKALQHRYFQRSLRQIKQIRAHLQPRGMVKTAGSDLRQ